MVERLTRLDASFLYLEEPDTPMHVGGVLILEAPPGGVDALADAGGGPAPARAAVPAAGGRGARATWPTRCGSTIPTSTSPITCAATACPGRAPRRSCSTWFPAGLAPAAPQAAALGDVPGRRPLAAAGWRSSPRPTPPSSTG